MSLFEQAFGILKSDIRTMVDGLAKNIVNAPLAHSDYLSNQGKITAFSFMHDIIERVQDYIAGNPDGELSSSFIAPIVPEDRTVDDEPVVEPVADPVMTTSIDIESGDVTQATV